MKLFVIDLDGTLTKRDNLIAFSAHMLRREKQYRFWFFYFLGILFTVKILKNLWLKRCLYRFVIRTYSKEALEGYMERYISASRLKEDINNEVVAFIQQQQDTENVLLTANYDFIALPILKELQLNIQDVIGVTTHYSGNTKVNWLKMQTPYGNDKIRMLEDYLKEKDFDELLAIGDSSTDLPLLHFVDRGYLVTYGEEGEVGIRAVKTQG